MRRAAEYGLDNAWRQARARLTSLESWLDPHTTRHLAATGVSAGWQCLEVGAGGGSIASWLCERVGPQGEVVATDLDTRFLASLGVPNLRVRRHDVAVDDLPEEAFDLVHCRLVLAHVPERDRAFSQMVASVRPGGWVVVEEMDFGSVATDRLRPGGQAFLDCTRATNDVLRSRGFDPTFGRRLLGVFTTAGLTNIETGGHARVWPGGSVGAEAWRLTFEQLSDQMLARGVDEQAVATAVELCQDPGFTFMSQVTMGALGQRSSLAQPPRRRPRGRGTVQT